MTWRRLILPALATLSALALARGQARADCNNPFANPNEVLDFDIRMSKADWDAILAEDATQANPDGDLFNPPQCAYKYKQYRAEFRCGGGAWLKVSVRKKRGQERGNEAPQKPPLKIDFNQDFMGAVPEAKDQSWPASFGALGFRKLTLANGQGNKPPNKVENLMLPILMTEHVTLRLLKREIPATPSAAFAKLNLILDGGSPKYIGVYGLVEDIDKAALKRNFGNNDGRLIKSTKDNCFNEIEFDDGGPNEAALAFEAFIKKNPAEFAGKMAEAEKAVDLDSLLRQEAIREILVNGDDTILTAANRSNEGLNYFTFDPKKGVRQYIPWDVDLTFGQQNGNCAAGTPEAPSTASPDGMRLMCAPDEPLFRWCADSLSEIGKRTICVKPEQPQEIRQRYMQIMCQLTKGTLAADQIVKLWDEVHASIKNIVPLEKDLVWQGMDPTAANIPKSFGAEYIRLRDWIPKRIKSVQEQLTKLGVACSPGCQDGAKEACTYLGCGGERRCAGNLWTSCAPTATCAQPQPKNPTAPPPATTPPATTAKPAADSGGCRFASGQPDGPGSTGPLALALLVLLALARPRRRG